MSRYAGSSCDSAKASGTQAQKLLKLHCAREGPAELALFADDFDEDAVGEGVPALINCLMNPGRSDL